MKGEDEVKKERKVIMHRKKVYSCNLVGFKRKENTLVGIKVKGRLYQVY